MTSAPRSIKFRLYDVNAKQMVYYSDGWNDSIDVLAEVWKFIECGGYTIQQATGIYDRNNQEIFEGDVIEYWWYGGKFSSKHVVVWDNKSAKFILKDDKEKVYKNVELYHNHTYKVLGNIFENAELLKG